MYEPIWDECPAYAPKSLYAALPALPKLLVHLAALRAPSAFRCPTADEIQAYLEAPLTASLPRCHLPGLREAAERLALAVQRRERVGIHGDYDVDGVTSTALLASWLRELGVDVEVVLPHRELDGYGLGAAALRRLSETGCRLVLAIDCGITAVMEAALARSLGIELIILDHHEPAEALPEALVVVDPKLPGGDPGDCCLAAVGLAYRLCETMVAAGAGNIQRLEALLDLVALGTIADVAPLTGQNRLLVSRGLRVLRTGARPGLAALAKAAGVKQERLTTEDVAFRLAPRLNAAGRLDHPSLAFDLLMARDVEAVEALAGRLEELNRLRQTLTESALAAAVSRLGLVNGEPVVLIATGDDWRPGIVGLVAGKLADRYHRPAIALTALAGELRGSARSIDGFDVTAALRNCEDLLLRCGGHARAAGLSLEPWALEPLRLRLLELAGRQISAEQLRPRHSPQALVAFRSLTSGVVRSLERLGPFGEGNPEPLVQSNDLVVRDVRRIGRDGAHASLHLRGGGVELRAVFFRADPQALPEAGSRVDALYVPQVNGYNGDERVEPRLVALRPAAQPA